jgi:hypothetical protein
MLSVVAERIGRVLARLEDFRLLPVLVAVSMAVGVVIGKALSISDFALTPPIEAIKSIVAGSFELSVPNVISLGVPIGLFAMMYAAMTNVRLGEVGSAFRAPRQLVVVLLFNYFVAPFLMLGLANLFVSDPVSAEQARGGDQPSAFMALASGGTHALDGGEMLAIFAADHVQLRPVQSQLGRDLGQLGILLGGDDVIRSDDCEAGLHQPSPLVLGRVPGELAGDEVVLGATIETALVLGYLDDQHRLSTRQAADLAHDLLHQPCLGIGDLEVSVSGPAENVGEPGKVAALFGRQCLELGDDPPNRGRLGVVGRRGRPLDARRREAQQAPQHHGHEHDTARPVEPWPPARRLTA